jgi:hypothetical protein
MKSMTLFRSKDYYVPRYKADLVRALSNHFHTSESKFGRMKMGQLYAIFYKMRGGHDEVL